MLKLKNKKNIILLLVFSLIIVLGVSITHRKTGGFVFIDDIAVPLGGLTPSVPIETEWDYNSDNWVLTFEDDFDGGSGRPDASKWEVQEYNRRNNDNGPDGYWKKENVYQDGKGNLVIAFSEIENQNNDGDDLDYATGMVRSKDIFEQTYGKFEIRCKLPQERGWWVSFWLMSDGILSEANGGKDGAEIDIFEGFGWNEIVYHTIHWDGYESKHRSVYNFTKLANRDDYHVYTLIWTPTEYQYYIDGQLTWVTKGGGVSQVDQYLKITGECATNGWFVSKDWAENPKLASLPDEFLVDYVKVYKYEGEEAAGVPATYIAQTDVLNVENSTANSSQQANQTTTTDQTVESTVATVETQATATETLQGTTSAPETQTTSPSPVRRSAGSSGDQSATAEKRSTTTTTSSTETTAAELVQSTTTAPETEAVPKVKALSISQEKTSYKIGDEITWTVVAEGKNVRYRYYLSKDTKNIDITPFGDDNTYSFIADSDGEYHVVCYVIDDYNVQDYIQSEIAHVIAEPLEFVSITSEKDLEQSNITWNIESSGDEVRYSAYILENGSVVEITPYSHESSITYAAAEGNNYRALIYARDKHGNAI